MGKIEQNKSTPKISFRGFGRILGIVAELSAFRVPGEVEYILFMKVAGQQTNTEKQL